MIVICGIRCHQRSLDAVDHVNASAVVFLDLAFTCRCVDVDLLVVIRHFQNVAQGLLLGNVMMPCFAIGKERFYLQNSQTLDEDDPPVGTLDLLYGAFAENDLFKCTACEDAFEKLMHFFHLSVTSHYA